MFCDNVIKSRIYKNIFTFIILVFLLNNCEQGGSRVNNVNTNKMCFINSCKIDTNTNKRYSFGNYKTIKNYSVSSISYIFIKMLLLYSFINIVNSKFQLDKISNSVFHCNSFFSNDICCYCITNITQCSNPGLITNACRNINDTFNDCILESCPPTTSPNLVVQFCPTPSPTNNSTMLNTIFISNPAMLTLSPSIQRWGPLSMILLQLKRKMMTGYGSIIGIRGFRSSRMSMLYFCVLLLLSEIYPKGIILNKHNIDNQAVIYYFNFIFNDN